MKATKNSGLQPAMDHLIENSDNPIPEPGAQAGGSAGEPMDEDEEADAAAFGLKVAGADEEAKVRFRGLYQVFYDAEGVE